MVSQKLGHIPGLDGLRAIAIIGVLMFHLRIVGASLGHLGVQLFFVISGFLITRILLNARNDTHPFRSFYIRRALRIFPIYYLYLAMIVIVQLASSSAGALRTLPFYIAYVQNIPSLMLGSGLVASSHTWSLALEEQFYWLWPMAVLWLAPTRLRHLVAGLILAAPLFRLAVNVTGANSYLATGTLPSQMDSILVGAAIAVALHFGLSSAALRRVGMSAMLVGGAAVGAIVANIGLEPFWSFKEWTGEGLGFLLYSAVAVLFGGVVAVVVSGASPQILEAKPLAWTGRVSYGIYLYHGLVFHLVNMSVEGVFSPLMGSPLADFVVMLVKVVLTLGVVAVSWRFVEKPALDLKDRLAPAETSAPPGDAEFEVQEDSVRLRV